MGPLAGVKIIEIAGIGPGPFCGMMLADMGAEVIRVDRASAPANAPRSNDVLARGRRSIALNLKKPEAIETVLKLCEQADALFPGRHQAPAPGFSNSHQWQRSKPLAASR